MLEEKTDESVAPIDDATDAPTKRKAYPKIRKKQEDASEAKPKKERKPKESRPKKERQPKREPRPKKKAMTQDELVLYVREAEEQYSLNPKLSFLCEEYAKKLFIQRKLRKQMAPAIRTDVMRLAIIATGLLEKGLLTEEDLNACSEMEQLMETMRKVLGFKTYSLILETNTNKRAMMRLARVELKWEAINSFRLSVTIPSGESPFTRYVDAYKEEARLIKLRVLLAETIEKNIPLSERARYISKPRKDPNGPEQLSYRTVFSYLVMTAYFGLSTDKKRLNDFIEFKAYCVDNFATIRENVKKLLVQMIQPEQAAEGIYSLPELGQFFTKVEALSKAESLHSFISYFDSDNDAIELAQEVKRVVGYVGKWKWRRSRFTSSREPGDIVSQSLAKVTNKEFLMFVHRFPWFAKFLLKKEVVRYLFLVPTTDPLRVQVEAYIKPELIAESQLFLSTQITIEKFLELYMTDAYSEKGSGIELVALAGALTRKATASINDERIARRADLYIFKILDQWRDSDLVKLFTQAEVPKEIAELLSHDFKVYLWYLRKETKATWTPPFEFDESILDFVNAADVAKYLEKCKLKEFHDVAQREAQQDINKAKIKTDTKTAETGDDDDQNVQDDATNQDIDVNDFDDDIVTEEEIPKETEEVDLDENTDDVPVGE